MIASHYAEPLERVIETPTLLRSAPNEEATVIAELAAGQPFAMLDDSLGWAWGYGGSERRVGYVPAQSIAQ